MRYQPKQINCMRDHTLMQHSHINLHTNKSNTWITQRCHFGCFVYRHLFFRLFFFGWFYLQMLSRSQQACIWPAICFQPSHEASCHRRSLALSSTVHIRAHWGNARPDTIASQWFYKFLMHFCSCFRFDYLTTSQRDDLGQVCTHR